MIITKELKFLAIARSIATLSKDHSTQVGALALGLSGEIRAMGYNGFPRGCNDELACRHERPEKYLWAEHAERNLIYNAARVGVPLEGCTLIVTPLFPCMDCARGIVQSGFRRVIAEATNNPRWKEANDKALELFREVGIEVTRV